MHDLHPLPNGSAPIIAEKSALRRTIGQLRDALDPSVRVRQTSLCLAQFLGLPEYRTAQKILCTMSFGSELDTKVLIEQMRAGGKQIVLPRVAPSSASSGQSATDLLLFLVDANTPLETSKWGITEPTLAAQPVHYDELDLVIVPGLAFDSSGNRLGYGRGYFDRLLKKLPTTTMCAALCFDCQLVEKVPVSVFDQKVDILISAAGLHTITK